MKIFHVITTIERGGAENALLTLAKAQASRGHEVVVIPLKGYPELKIDLTQSGVKVTLSALNKPIIFQLRALRSIVDRKSIIHAHLPRAEILCRIAFGTGQAVLTRHNAEKFFPSAPKFISSSLSKWVTKGSRLIAISKAVLDFLEDNSELSETCISSTIHYGYERKFPSLVRSFKLVKKNGVLRIGTVSRLVPQKNLPLLIKLTHLLAIAGYDVETSIIGSGPLNAELRHLTRKLNLEDRVLFLGRTSKVMECLEKLDCFVLTSHYEGFGLALLEAMDARIPIVAPRNSAIPEVLGCGHPGLFQSDSITSLKKHILLMTENEEVRRLALELQENRLDHFSVKNYLDRHESLYASLRVTP